MAKAACLWCQICETAPKSKVCFMLFTCCLSGGMPHSLECTIGCSSTLCLFVGTSTFYGGQEIIDKRGTHNTQPGPCVHFYLRIRLERSATPFSPFNFCPFPPQNRLRNSFFFTFFHHPFLPQNPTLEAVDFYHRNPPWISSLSFQPPQKWVAFLPQNPTLDADVHAFDFYHRNPPWISSLSFQPPQKWIAFLRHF